MKYLEQYIEEKLKIKALGKLTTLECDECDGLGVSLVIDGYQLGLEVWYADYAKWLEEKLDEYGHKLDEYILFEKKSPDEEEQISLTFEGFRDEEMRC